MSIRVRRRDAGFSLYEAVVAVFLLGIAVHPLVTTLSHNVRSATDRGDRLDAERILRNELALAQAGGAPGESSRSYRAARTGRPDPAGPFLVTVRREVRCGVGAAPADNLAEPPPTGCASGGAVVDLTIQVVFPRPAGAAAMDTLIRTISLAASDPRGTGGAP